MYIGLKMHLDISKPINDKSNSISVYVKIVMLLLLCCKVKIEESNLEKNLLRTSLDLRQ